jgi:hypothetical protein
MDTLHTTTTTKHFADASKLVPPATYSNGVLTPQIESAIVKTMTAGIKPLREGLATLAKVCLVFALLIEAKPNVLDKEGVETAAKCVQEVMALLEWVGL